MRDFTSRHLDLYLATARAILTGSRPPDPALAAEHGDRRRLIWRILADLRAARLDEAYVRAIATDLFGLACWRDLALADLRTLRDTIHNRARARAVPADMQPF
jgi:hypothetical protein